MKLFKVYFEIIENPYVEIIAKNEQDALDKAKELYEEQDSYCFEYSGHFNVSEAYEQETI